MNNKVIDTSIFKVLDKVQKEIKKIESSCLDYEIKEKLHDLLDYINEETTNDKEVLSEMIYDKVKKTKGVSSELNTYFYLLYRNFEQGKVSVKEAQRLYEMYVKELRTL